MSGLSSSDPLIKKRSLVCDATADQSDLQIDMLLTEKLDGMDGQLDEMIELLTEIHLELKKELNNALTVLKTIDGGKWKDDTDHIRKLLAKHITIMRGGGDETIEVDNGIRAKKNKIIQLLVSNLSLSIGTTIFFGWLFWSVLRVEIGDANTSELIDLVKGKWREPFALRDLVYNLLLEQLTRGGEDIKFGLDQLKHGNIYGLAMMFDSVDPEIAEKRLGMKWYNL